MSFGVSAGRRVLGLVAATLLASSVCNAATGVEASSRQWAADWSAKKLDAVMALYAPDAEFMPGSSDSWVGTAAIRKNFAVVLAQYSADLHLHSVRSAASGDLAYDSGTYDEMITEIKTGKVIRPRGNYLFVFRRQKNGEWKILEQTWTQFGPRKL